MQKQTVILIVFFIALPSFLFGQLQVPENQPSEFLSGRGIIIPDNATSHYLHLYNGIEYVNYDNGVEGYQFFASDVLEKGVIIYDGILYQNVAMHYDIVKDEVVIEHFHQYFKIRLIPEKIAHFSLLNHTFARIEADSLPDAGITTGFYEKLYDGKVKVLAKRIKLMKEEIADHQVKRRFVQKDRYFVYKDAAYFQVKGKHAIIRVFKDHKKEIRKFIQEQNLDFKNNPEAAFTSLSRFYDNLHINSQ